MTAAATRVPRRARSRRLGLTALRMLLLPYLRSSLPFTGTLPWPACGAASQPAPLATRLARDGRGRQ